MRFSQQVFLNDDYFASIYLHKLAVDEHYDYCFSLRFYRDIVRQKSNQTFRLFSGVVTKCAQSRINSHVLKFSYWLLIIFEFHNFCTILPDRPHKKLWRVNIRSTNTYYKLLSRPLAVSTLRMLFHFLHWFACYPFNWSWIRQGWLVLDRDAADSTEQILWLFGRRGNVHPMSGSFTSAVLRT